MGVFIVRIDFFIAMVNKNTIFYFIDMNENAPGNATVICEPLCLSLDLVIQTQEIVFLYSILRQFTENAKNVSVYLMILCSWC